MEITAEYRAIFAEEAREHLEEWEGSLLRLEKSPDHDELIHQMLRAIHTLKGSAGFIGFEKLQRLTHDLETSLQDVRDGAAELDGEIIEMLFRGLDLSERMVGSFNEGKDFETDIEEFLEALSARHTGSGQRGITEATQEQEQPSGSTDGGEAACVGLMAVTNKEKEVQEGGKALELELFIRSSGREGYLRSFLVRNRLAGVAKILSEDPAPEYLKGTNGRFAYRITVKTNADEATLREALNIDLLEITSITELNEKDLQDRLQTHATEKSSPGNPSETTARPSKTEEVVRVSVEKLDILLNLVGELVIQNSGFVSIAQDIKKLHGRSLLVAELEEKTESLAKITRDLQDGIMKVRMLPVTNVFNRFYRVVRDLAKDRKKEINLDVFGEETEIDKKVMDRIGDPLVHLIRNAVDHGIESRGERLTAGKVPVGLIRLGAYQDGDHICIEVSDDGRGLDKDAILTKAIEKGLVRREEAGKLTSEQVLNLIFLPGLSTAKEVSEVSGRGVGMDVVKRAIEGMGGSIRIRSFIGKGTTVTISLPLTMAIIPAVLVEVNQSTLAVPLSSVREVLKVRESELKSVGQQQVIRLREEVLAMVYLREALSLESNGSKQEHEDRRLPVVVVNYEEKKIGLGVDRVTGTAEIVIKSLSRHYRETENLIGASILGNGRIALIVDVEALVKSYHHVNGDERAFAGRNIFGLEAQENHPPGCPAKTESTVLREPTVPAIEDNKEQSGKKAQIKESAGDGELSAENTPDEREKEEEEIADAFLNGRAMNMRECNRLLLEEVHNAGAIQASMAISQMTGLDILVSFPESHMVPLTEVADLLGGEEEPVGGIYVGLLKDLVGGILLVLPVADILKFHELLYREPSSTCTSLEKVDLSGISELGNILAASFLNAMADETQLRIKSETPEITVDMCLPVIDSVLARFNQPGEHILLTRAEIFGGDTEHVVCHLLMFLEPESLQKLVNAITDDLKQAGSD
jgi:two-component system chemotaxis sensor kinase CheA